MLNLKLLNNTFLDYTTTVSTTTEEFTTASLTTTELTTETVKIKKGDQKEVGNDKGMEDVSDEDSIYGGSDTFDQDLTSNYETSKTNSEEVIYYDTISDKNINEEEKNKYDYYELEKDSDSDEKTSLNNDEFETKHTLSKNNKGLFDVNDDKSTVILIPMTRYRTRATTTTTTQKPLPMTKTLTYARGIDKTTILVTWKRQTKLTQGKQLRELSYIFRYKVKGLPLLFGIN